MSSSQFEPVIYTTVNTANANGKIESKALICSEKQLEYILKALSNLEFDWDPERGKISNELHESIAGPIEDYFIESTKAA